jgi:hypothetical protein
MPQTSANTEYTNMIFAHSFWNRNGRSAAAEYLWQYPHHRVPYHSTFPDAHRTLSETFSSHEGMQNASNNGKEKMVLWIQCSKVNTQAQAEYPR